MNAGRNGKKKKKNNNHNNKKKIKKIFLNIRVGVRVRGLHLVFWARLLQFSMPVSQSLYMSQNDNTLGLKRISSSSTTGWEWNKDVSVISGFFAGIECSCLQVHVVGFNTLTVKSVKMFAR